MKPLHLSIILILLSFISNAVLTAKGIQDLPADTTSAEYKLALQRKIFPQEKLHVMTDAELYMPGDTIWMRIWVQDGETLKNSQLGSEFVYVNLIDNRDVSICSTKIKQRENKFAGYLPLPKTIVSGHYTMTVNTHYQHKTEEQYICKKLINIITRENLRAGYTVRPLYEHQLAPAMPLTSTDVIYPRRMQTDTLQHVTLQLPPNTWFAISVTDDLLNPTDTTFSIDHQLTQLPDYFTLESVQADSNYYRSTTFPETDGIIAGIFESFQKLKPKAKEQANVTIVNLKTQRVYFSKPNEQGEFYVSNVDLPDGSYLCYMPFDGTTRKYEVTPYTLLQHEKLHHIETGRSQYFVNRHKEQLRNMGINTHGVDPELALLRAIAQEISNDSIRLLEEAEKTLHRSEQTKLEKIVQRTIYTDDIYTRNATRTILNKKFSKHPSKRLVADIAQMFSAEGLGITAGSGLYYHSPEGKKLPVRIVVGTKEWPLTFQTDSTLQLCDALRIPSDIVYAVDYIHPSVARQIAPSLDYPESPILHIDLMTPNEAAYYSSIYNYTLNKAEGYQEYKIFPNNRISKRALHTRYWNPAVYSSPSGQVSIDLPLPQNHSTTYTLRAEGVTPDGQPVTILRRIQM